MTEILKAIGTPALLEQCAEECAELAHACLKMARIARGENPTNKNELTAYEELIEEAADVELCLEALVYGYPLSRSKIEWMKETKRERWKKRVTEQNK